MTDIAYGILGALALLLAQWIRDRVSAYLALRRLRFRLRARTPEERTRDAAETFERHFPGGVASFHRKMATPLWCAGCGRSVGPDDWRKCKACGSCEVRQAEAKK